MDLARIRLICAAICASLALSGSASCAQDGLMEKPHKSLLKTEAVEYLYPEQVTLPAGKSSPVTLHFRIQPNLHINSHTPREQYLIPTVF